MKSSKTRIVLVVVELLFLFAFVVILFIVSSNFTNDEYYTEDVYDFFENMYDDEVLFSKEIPNNATVSNFMFYKYFTDRRDVYLELKFDTAEDMDNYIAALLTNFEEYYRSKYGDNVSLLNEYLVETVCPYDNSYNEIFITLNTTKFGNDPNYYVGFAVDDQYHNFKYYDCNYSILSYSTENLTVIQTSALGSFSKELKHIPGYIQKYNIPLEKSHEHLIIVD